MSSKPARQRPGGASPLGRKPLAPEVEQLHVGRPASTETRGPVNPASTEPANHGIGESRTEPRYAQYVRKEARVRDDQAAALVVLRKKVAGQRTAKVEPITDNVLIRLAVDLLLANSGRLHGDTEDELRAALLGSVDTGTTD